MYELEVQHFIQILSSDDCAVFHEDDLIEPIRTYIAIREKEVKKPKSAEEQTRPELWALLSEEERKTR